MHRLVCYLYARIASGARARASYSSWMKTRGNRALRKRPGRVTSSSKIWCRIAGFCKDKHQRVEPGVQEPAQPGSLLSQVGSAGGRGFLLVDWLKTRRIFWSNFQPVYCRIIYKNAEIHANGIYENLYERLCFFVQWRSLWVSQVSIFKNNWAL